MRVRDSDSSVQLLCVLLQLLLFPHVGSGLKKEEEDQLAVVQLKGSSRIYGDCV